MYTLKQLFVHNNDRVFIISRFHLIHAVGISYSSFMDNVGPIMDEASKKSGVTAQQVVQEVLSQTAGGQTGKTILLFLLIEKLN